MVFWIAERDPKHHLRGANHRFMFAYAAKSRWFGLEVKNRCQRQLETDMATIRNAHMGGPYYGVAWSVIAGPQLTVRGFVLECAGRLLERGDW